MYEACIEASQGSEKQTDGLQGTASHRDEEAWEKIRVKGWRCKPRPDVQGGQQRPSYEEGIDQNTEWVMVCAPERHERWEPQWQWSWLHCWT